MNYLEDYFEDQSEADQIIEEASDKLVSLISEKVKTEIETYKNKFEYAKERADNLQREVYEQREKIEVLEKAKKEFERQDNELPKVPFMPGEEIWWVGSECRNTVTIECPICKGNGKVKTQTADYGEVEIICPHCKGKRLAKYEFAKAYPGYVVKSYITLNVKEDVPPIFSYELVESQRDLERFKSNMGGYTLTRSEIYKTKEEAEKAANQETEKRKTKAEEALCSY